LVVTCSSDNTVKIWNISLNWALIRTFKGHTSFVEGFDWLNEDTIISWSYDYTVRIWAISTGLALQKIPFGTYVWSLQVLSNGIHFAAGIGSNNNVNIYSLDTGDLVRSLQGHTSAIWNLALISGNNGELLASASNDGTLRLWNLTSNTCKFILQGHSTGVVVSKQITSDVLASGAYDATIKLWNITSGNLIRTLTGHSNYIFNSIDLLSNGGQSILVSGSWDQTIKLWNWSTGECLRTLNTSSQISSLSFVNRTKSIGLKNSFF
jgi:WD40 repeat protein